MKRVFLGGTCNESSWREDLISILKIDYFNPIVEEWNEEDRKRELKEKEICDFCLYVITPKMKGFYSIAEVIDDSNKRPEKTIFCVLTKDGNQKFDAKQLNSFDAIKKMVKRNGGKVFSSLEEISKYF